MGGGRLLLASPPELGQLALEGGETDGDEGGQALGAGDGLVELAPPGLSLLALAGVTGQALVELGQAPGEVGAALVEAGGAHLEAGAQGAHRRHPFGKDTRVARHAGPGLSDQHGALFRLHQ